MLNSQGLVHMVMMVQADMVITAWLKKPKVQVIVCPSAATCAEPAADVYINNIDKNLISQSL